MNSRTVLVGLALAGFSALGAACAREASPFKSPWDQAPVGSSTARSTTTITGAPVPGRATAGLDISQSLVRACAIHFENIEQSPKFDFDRSDITDQDRSVLQQIATCVTIGPLAGRHLQLTGRADPRGEVEYNLGLGAHRAASAASYLERLGVSSSNLAETSRGKLDATGTDEASWQTDRRVDIDLR